MDTSHTAGTSSAEEWVRIVASICFALITMWSLWVLYLLLDPSAGPLTLHRVSLHVTMAAALLVWWASPFLLIVVGRRSAVPNASLWIRSVFLPFFLLRGTWGWIRSGRPLYLASGVAFFLAVVVGFALSRRISRATNKAKV
jgi:hypothetical protein